MSYATPAQLRVYLDQDETTLNDTLQDLLDRANSTIDLELGFAFLDTGSTATQVARLSIIDYENPDLGAYSYASAPYAVYPTYGQVAGPHAGLPYGTGLWRPGQERLTLPTGGAGAITSVVEDGTTLASSLYELEPAYGRYLLRLDATGEVFAWSPRRRHIVVTYTPAAAPDALVQAELAEAVRLWKAKGGGFSDAVGVPGSNERIYSKAMLSSTRQLIERLRKLYIASMTNFDR